MSKLTIPPGALAAARFAWVRWELLTPGARKAALAATACACAGALWLGAIGPAVAQLRMAKADRLSIETPDAPTAEELWLAADKASFAKLKAASLDEGGAPAASPDALGRIGAAAGRAFAGVSVDASAGWPQASGDSWRHLVELRLAGSWPDLAAAIDRAEPLANGTASEFAIDRAPDGRLAARVRWIVSSPRRDWGSSAREAPAAPAAAPAPPAASVPPAAARPASSPAPLAKAPLGLGGDHA